MKMQGRVSSMFRNNMEEGSEVEYLPVVKAKRIPTSGEDLRRSDEVRNLDVSL